MEGDFAGRLTLSPTSRGHIVSASGELSNRELLPGGVAYSLTHEFSDTAVTKTVRLRYHGKKPAVDLVEPIVRLEGMRFERLDGRTLLIHGREREFRFEILEGNAAIDSGSTQADFWNVFPSVRAQPIELHVSSPEQAVDEKVVWRIGIVR